ncbi:MAG: DUF2442 domain-containing protein [Anaerolineales bacterium]|nr:DUF2442 domain-containing protein [Anaerolineales bacterium]
MEYPKIIAVKPLKNYRLLVSFRNGVQKIYDCSDLLEKPVFQPLKDKAFFKAVRVDQGGYGIRWSDEVNLAEAELWVNGVEVKGAVSELAV